MWSFLLIALASSLNALMDLVENENFHRSIFAKLTTKFWYKRESWKYAIKFLDWKADAWHIAKSLMIVLICLAIVCYQPVFGRLLDFLVMGFIWNIVFNVLYNKVFIK